MSSILVDSIGDNKLRATRSIYTLAHTTPPTWLPRSSDVGHADLGPSSLASTLRNPLPEQAQSRGVPPGISPSLSRPLEPIYRLVALDCSAFASVHHPLARRMIYGAGTFFKGQRRTP